MRFAYLHSEQSTNPEVFLMELNGECIERLSLQRLRTARRWICEGGVVIAAAAAGDQTRLEFSDTIIAGVRLQVTSNLCEVGKACKFLTDYALYLWNCDQDGDYMLYEAPKNEGYPHTRLSGASDLPAFRRIAATCFAGSYPDVHIDVHRARPHAAGSAAACAAGVRRLLGRMLLPEGVCAAIYQSNPRAATAWSRPAVTAPGANSQRVMRSN